MPWRAHLSLPQVAEIHQASKDGKLYDMGGSAKSCSAQAEPPEPTEYDIRPASQVYSVSGVHPKLESRKGTPSLCPQLGHTLSWHRSSALGCPRAGPQASLLCHLYLSAPQLSSHHADPQAVLRQAFPSPTPKRPLNVAIPGPASKCPPGAWWSERFLLLTAQT